MAKKKEPADFVGPTVAARILETSAETIRRWAKSGKLTPVPIDGMGAVYARSEVERLAAERRKGPQKARPAEG